MAHFVRLEKRPEPAGVVSAASRFALEVLPVREDTLRRMSVGDLLQRLIADVSALAARQIELAKQEARDEARQRLRAIVLLVVGSVLLFLAVVSILVAIILAVSLVLPGWGAALVLFGGLAVVGGILALIGQRQLTRPLLPKTRQTLREDVEWAGHLTNSSEK